MKKILAFALLIGLLTSVQAYCETGRKISQDFVPGGFLVTYDFGNARLLSFKFPSGASIPYTLRYDFYRYEMCY